MSWHDLRGWFAFEETYREMAALAEPGDVFVEVGVAFGRSLAFLARQLLDRGLGTPSKPLVALVGVDPWVDDWWCVPEGWTGPTPTWGAEHAEWARAQGGPFNAFVAGMREHAPEELEYAKIWRTTSRAAARLTAQAHGNLCRGVMIDGDHSYEGASSDIEEWRSLMARGGILAGDDYSDAYPGVLRAVKEAFGPDGFEVRGTTWVVRT